VLVAALGPGIGVVAAPAAASTPPPAEAGAPPGTSPEASADTTPAATAPDSSAPDDTDPTGSTPTDSAPDAAAGDEDGLGAELDPVSTTVAVFGFLALITLASWWMVRRSGLDAPPGRSSSDRSPPSGDLI